MFLEALIFAILFYGRVLVFRAHVCELLLYICGLAAFRPSTTYGSMRNPGLHDRSWIRAAQGRGMLDKAGDVTVIEFCCLV